MEYFYLHGNGKTRINIKYLKLLFLITYKNVMVALKEVSKSMKLS